MNSSPTNGSGNDVERRLAELERKVAALESTSTGKSAALGSAPRAGTTAVDDAPRSATDDGGPGVGEDTFWALTGLIDHLGDEGGITYTGHTTPPGAEAPVSWQMGLSTPALRELDFAAAAPALAALGHPVRLELLQVIYDGTTTVAELGHDERFGTTGQIYHHVNALAGAGWLENSRRGHWRVPAQRIIPLLTLVLIGTH